MGSVADVFMDLKNLGIGDKPVSHVQIMTPKK